MRAGIPYKVIGGTRFYDRREIKDALAYLRAVVNPIDEVSVKRVLNVPKRGVGDSTVAKLDAWAASHGLHVHGGAAPGRRGRGQRPGRQGHRRLPRGHRRRGRARSTRAPARCSRRCSTAAATSPSCRSSTRSRPRVGSRTWPSWSARPHEVETVDEFLEQVSLVADTDEIDDDDSSVVLMTLHSAKGLEFPAVFLVGLEDGVFPHLRSLGEPDELEEERRLAYVGITRARERLYLSHAWSRTIFGVDAVQPAEPVPRRDPRSGSCRRSRATGGRPAAARGPSAAGSTSSWGERPRRESRISSERRQATRERRVDQALAAGRRRRRARRAGLRIGDDVRPRQVGRGRRARPAGQRRQDRGPGPLPDGGREASCCWRGPRSKKA